MNLRRATLAAVLLVSTILFSGCSSLRQPRDEAGAGESPDAGESSNADESLGVDAAGVSGEESWDLSRLDTARAVSYMSTVAKDVVLELNKVRSNPALYARLYLEPLLAEADSPALNEAIQVLVGSRRRGVLAPVSGLTQAAHHHVEDAGPAGLLGHTGTDGSTPAARVQLYSNLNKIMAEDIAFGSDSARGFVTTLLIDEGIRSRRNRRNILDSAYRNVGVAVGPHRTRGTMCVIVLAGGFVLKLGS